MRFVSFSHGDTSCWGLIDGSGIHKISHFSTLKEAIAAGDLAEAANLVTDEPPLAIEAVRLLPVIPDPGKIICVGLNYENHRKETGRAIVANPTIFMRFADSQTAHGADIISPPESDMLDYEGELAVVIGKPGRRIPGSRCARACRTFGIYPPAKARSLCGSSFHLCRGFCSGCRTGSVACIHVDARAAQTISIQSRKNGRMNSDQPPQLIGLVGSLRKHSLNRVLLEALSEHVRSVAKLPEHSLDDIPLYNMDLEAAVPPGVVTLRDSVSRADGVVIVSPEYNHGMPGVMKNALDWLSRPRDAHALKGKPVLVITLSPAITGGARAQAQLNETILGLGARPVVRPQCVVPLALEKIEQGRFTHQPTLNFLEVAITDLLKEAALVSSRC